jgi:hypothetical protein
LGLLDSKDIVVYFDEVLAKQNISKKGRYYNEGI